MTITTKKAANVKEALEILNSLLPNGSFVYDTENYSNDYKTTYRHFDATAQNGATCYGMIEFVENGNLVKVRFINIYRETAVDIEIENFSSSVATAVNDDPDENDVDDEDNVNNELVEKMAITTKEGANGRISAYYINGVKVRKAEVEYHACNPAFNGIIVVDYFTARHQFPNLYLYGSAVVFKNWVDGSDVMTKAAADRLGLKLGKKISLHPAIYRVVKNEVPDVEPNPVDYAIIAAAQDVASDAEIELATDYQHQTNWENPHDFTITGDLSGRNLNGRFIAANVALEQEQELRELKADGVQFLLKVKTPQMHPYTNFYFQNVINSYKSFDALKKLGRNKIDECDWRIESIDGKLIAKGTGSNEFNNFANAKEEVTLTDNMILAQKITDKLGSLLVKFSHANEGDDGGLALHYDTFKDEHDEFGTLTRVVEVFTDQTNFILDHVNFITGYGDDKKVEKFFFKRDDFSDFEQHLLALQKEQEDAYPEEVKALNRDLAQSNLTAPNMHLHIYNNDFHIGSFCGVELSKLHVKSFVTDKIHFNVCYASEPLEHYDTFEEVTAAIDHFKDAIKRGATQFKFPTSDELNLPTDKQINDSLVRAMETNLKNIQAHLLNNDINAAIAELNLYHICDNALLRKEVA